MIEIKEGLQMSFKEVGTDTHKLKFIIDGHKIDLILTTSQARNIVGLIDNGL